MDEARRGGYGYELMPVLKREYQCTAAVAPRTRPAYALSSRFDQHT